MHGVIEWGLGRGVAMAEIVPRGRSDFAEGPGQFLKRYPEVINDLGFYNGSSLTVMNGVEGPCIRCTQ